MRLPSVLVRPHELSLPKLPLVADSSWARWFRNRMRTAIVSNCAAYGAECLSDDLFSCRVTLYAEFLPTKQRAKCVVLLDVSNLDAVRGEGEGQVR